VPGITVPGITVPVYFNLFKKLDCSADPFDTGTNSFILLRGYIFTLNLKHPCTSGVIVFPYARGLFTEVKTTITESQITSMRIGFA
jgi:hypothetical protein